MGGLSLWGLACSSVDERAPSVFQSLEPDQVGACATGTAGACEDGISRTCEDGAWVSVPCDDAGEGALDAGASPGVRAEFSEPVPAPVGLASACASGDVDCDGILPLRCEDGFWNSGEPCAEDAPVCVPELGRCTRCVPGAARCGPNGIPQRCAEDGSAFLDVAACEDGAACIPQTGQCGQCSAGDRRPCAGALGACALGEEVCGEDFAWGECSVQPGIDTCEPGNDASCDGLPNSPPAGCECTADVSCGVSDVGQCAFGVSSCNGGVLGACVGAVNPAPRDCRSAADADCDGRSDDALDAICVCTPGAVESCQPHAGLDGTGICRAGRRTCEASANALSSNWGACLGSVAPRARDCSSDQDNDCNGVVDSREPSCQCTPGASRACDVGAGCGGLQFCTLSPDRGSSQFGPCQPGPLSFADANLEAAVREAFRVPSGPIPPAPNLTALGIFATARNIRSLAGIQCLTGLERLFLWENQISDLRPLSSLSKLYELNVADNQVTDVSPLRSITSLEILFVRRNPITDLSPLSGLPNLRDLVSEESSVSNIRGLGNLPRLQNLWLNDNRLTDISELGSLTSLRLLHVHNNPLDCSAPVMRTLSNRLDEFVTSCIGF